ncbi:MAG: peptidoglycan editing factor PgeF [Alphaproteobacteria bacterium]
MIPPLVSPQLNDCLAIKHGFFSRCGGVSKGFYASLNLRSSSKDDYTNIQENRKRVASFLDLNPENLIFLNQQHYNQVNIVENINTPRFDGDGLVTKISEIGLCIITADCVPVLLADNENKIIGACHSGWKGAFSGIIENTVQKMIDIGASLPNIVAGIGASIDVASYEVGEDFYQKFLQQDASAKDFFKDIKGQKHFNLKEYVAAKLKNCGIKKVDILLNDTFLEEETFFSYRRSTKRAEADYGCQVSVIVIK